MGTGVRGACTASASEYGFVFKMGNEFKGADFFACRYATAPRMEWINADPIWVMRWGSGV